MAEIDLTQLHLDVYDTRSGPWNPEHGAIETPDGWDFLPSGDAVLTRQVSAAGRCWLAWKPRVRGRGHRRRIGLWAPTQAIIAAGAAAERTLEARAVSGRARARQRERREERYRNDLRAAIVSYLDFADEHARLADQIANAAATRASEVGSGRVGRTSTLTRAEKAELAARAHIRHHHTDYERSSRARRSMETVHSPMTTATWMRGRTHTPRWTSSSPPSGSGEHQAPDDERPARPRAHPGPAVAAPGGNQPGPGRGLTAASGLVVALGIHNDHWMHTGAPRDAPHSCTTQPQRRHGWTADPSGRVTAAGAVRR